MPTLDKVSTVSSKSVWRSPDGQREIFEVMLDYQGNTFKGKTYSKDIATDGWSGTVETYEKEGRNGPETFVKQPAKENGYSGGGGRSYGSSPKQTTNDPFTMFLSYAKDLMVALIASEQGYTTERFAELLEDLNTGGMTLYDNRPGATDDKGVQSQADSPSKPVADVVIDVEDDDEPMDLSDLDAILGPREKPGEKPWKNS
jgi:hypothetical protein